MHYSQAERRAAWVWGDALYGDLARGGIPQHNAPDVPKWIATGR
jgi:hypothetical protein